MTKPNRNRPNAPQPDKKDEPKGLVSPEELGPGRENDGGESILSGQSREQDADEMEQEELPPKQPPGR